MSSPTFVITNKGNKINLDETEIVDTKKVMKRRPDGSMYIAKITVRRKIDPLLSASEELFATTVDLECKTSLQIKNKERLNKIVKGCCILAYCEMNNKECDQEKIIKKYTPVTEENMHKEYKVNLVDYETITDLFDDNPIKNLNRGQIKQIVKIIIRNYTNYLEEQQRLKREAPKNNQFSYIDDLVPDDDIDDGDSDDDSSFEDSDDESDDCKHTKTVTDSREGIEICAECGHIVNTNIVSQEAEWRNFSDDFNSGDKSRVGMAKNEMLSNISMSTGFGGKNRAQSNRMDRLQKICTYGKKESREFTLLKTFKEFDRKSEEYLHLSSSGLEVAKHLFKMIKEIKTKRQGPLLGIKAVCMHTASALQGEYIPEELFAKAFNIDMKMYNKMKKYFNFHMKDVVEKLSKNGDGHTTKRMENNSKSRVYISKLKLRASYSDEVDKLVKIVIDNNICQNHVEKSIIPGAILMVLLIHDKLEFSKNTKRKKALANPDGVCIIDNVEPDKYNAIELKKEISKVCEISTVTVHNVFKELKEYKSALTELLQN